MRENIGQRNIKGKMVTNQSKPKRYTEEQLRLQEVKRFENKNL